MAGPAADRRLLVLARHAKAEPYGGTDRERSLTARGRRDAAALGADLAALDLVPDRALVSAASRTQETWSALADAAGWELEPEVREDVYGAEPDDLLEVVRGVPADTSTVVVVGHNPTTEYLAGALAGTGDPGLLEQVLGGFPTAAAAVFEIDEWADLAEGTARLVHVRLPTA